MSLSDKVAASALKRRCNRLLNAPTTEIAIILAILVSVGLFVIEVGIGRDHRWHPEIVLAGHALTFGFVIELLLRFWVAPRKGRFFRQYWIDIIAVLPALRAFRILRIVRLVRLFRVGVLFHRRLRSVSSTLATGISLQVGVLLNVGIVVLIGALALHLIEGNNAAFDSLDETMWWSFFTVVAGEPVGEMPQSLGGKVVAAFVVLGGLTMFAVFTGVVSAVMVQRLKLGMENRELEIIDLNEHIVICGWNRAAALVLAELQADPQLRDQHIVVVCEAGEPPAAELAGLERGQLYFVRGDYTRVDVLDEVGIRKACKAILLADKSVKERSDQDRDARTVLAALTIEKLNPTIDTCAQLLDRKNNVQLQVAGVEEVVVGDEMSGRLIATSVRDHSLIGFFEELLSLQVGNQVFNVELPDTWIGETFVAAAARAKEEHDALLVAVQSAGEVLINPPGDTVLGADDRLMLIAREMPRLI